MIAAACLAGCSRGHGPIVIGSKNFTESVILGEIAAQHIEQKLRTRVDRRLNLGGTLLAHQALLSGSLDLYPEYTGTALAVVVKLPLSPDPAVVLERVRHEYRLMRLVWMPPLGFNNSFAMVVRGADARALGLETLSDAAHYRPGWVLGVGYEFMERPDGFPALMKVYSLPVKTTPISMDLGLLYQALQQNQANMAAGNATDGLLSKLDLKVLRDDKHAFPPYQASYVVRASRLDTHPGLREAIDELSGKISEQVMQKMNYAVDGQHQAVPEVARNFLRQAGLSLGGN